MTDLSRFTLRAGSLCAIAVLAACTSLPTQNPELDQARAGYRSAQADSIVAQRAPVELKVAGDMLNRATDAWAREESNEEVNHLAYLTTQRTAIAREVAARKTAEATVADATAMRDQVRLAARTQEAERATRDATLAQQEAQAAQRQSDASTRRADASQQQAMSAQMQADAAARDAVVARARSSQLEDEIKALNATQTSRGLVITIGDVLFDTGRSQLSAAGERSVAKLGSFLVAHPQRRALVEGFTDSVGTEDMNQMLSMRRADTVRTALIGQGIDRDRVSAQGYGEMHPVASNDSATGRQQNRRVEVVLSGDGGRVAPR